MDRYVVIGNPIEHSRSPEIHRAFAEQVSDQLKYETLLGYTQLDGEESFESQVRAFFSDGGKGMNVTLPFKERAFAICDFVTHQAKQAQAVNTLWMDGKYLYGHNTDGLGLVADLQQCLIDSSAQDTTGGKPEIEDSKVLILGAGGAVRGVLAPLLVQRPSKIFIVNRTVEKAQSLAEQFSAFGNIEACTLGKYPKTQMDIIINGTSLGLTGEVPTVSPEWFGQKTVCYDMVYGKQQTAFLSKAQSCGAVHLFDGFGMLVAQAAAAFQLWRRVKVDYISVKNNLSQ